MESVNARLLQIDHLQQGYFEFQREWYQTF